MRLEEIEPSKGADQRVKQLKANARAAKGRAKQMQTQADAANARLEMQHARQKLLGLQDKAAASTVKPYK